FSESVAEDGQLVAVNRGAASMIATFADEPYRAPFSGNVIELCPVGALTSTQYRFQARPWEIQDVPTVCGLCPVGCNVSATTREGKVKRIVSRNHPEVDEGWLCDKGRFSYPHLYAEDRLHTPLVRRPRAGIAEASWDEAIDEAERLLRAAGERTVVALSGSETIELAYGLGKVVRGGRLRTAERAVVIWSGAGDKGGAQLAALSAELGLADKPGCGAFHLPATPNGRGVAEAWAASADADETNPNPIGLLIVSGDEA